MIDKEDFTVKAGEKWSRSTPFYGKLMAPLGQAASHAWHSVHSSALTNAAFSFAISMHSVGQMLTHSPHPSHFSVSNTGGILNPPFFV
jgi:hypothetical protein